jgi:hypothetical protein
MVDDSCTQGEPYVGILWLVIKRWEGIGKNRSQVDE